MDSVWHDYIDFFKTDLSYFVHYISNDNHKCNDHPLRKYRVTVNDLKCNPITCNINCLFHREITHADQKFIFDNFTTMSDTDIMDTINIPYIDLYRIVWKMREALKVRINDAIRSGKHDDVVKLKEFLNVNLNYEF